MDALKPFQDQIEKILLNPQYHSPLVLLKAIRNGLVYGTKVRFPHAFVMVFLFRSGTLREKLWLIFKATRQHASNLARFALFYKSSMLALKGVNGGKEESFHTFLAGLVGGYWVFGHGRGASSSVNQQIVIYVFARVVLAAAKLAVQPPGDNSLVGGSYGGHGGKGLLGLTDRQLEMSELGKRDVVVPILPGDAAAEFEEQYDLYIYGLGEVGWSEDFLLAQQMISFYYFDTA
ncbi:hypothetical protein LTR86_005458 [Recurvomyces mirabilis]|nr:hypothetical protein LTR86_005458 [Recurvomyces mirabilis]